VGNYSVYIIDEVHMLSQAAFNAFLKTLEEPPSYAIFILCTTEKHKVLPTILSRCQTYDFNRIGISDMVSNLRGIADKEGVKVDDESLHVIARKADGAMRDALTIFDQTVAFCGNDIKYADVIRNLGVLDYEYSFSLVDNFLSGDYASALLGFDGILSKGFNALHFVSALGDHFRNLLVARTGGLESLLDLPESLKAKYRAQAAGCSVKFIYDALGIITDCEAGFKSSTNQRLLIEYALMKLAFLGGVPAEKAETVPSETAATLGTLRGGTMSKANGGVERSETVSEGTVSAIQNEEAIELLDIEEGPAPEEPSTPARRRSSRAKAVMSDLLGDGDAEKAPVAEKPAVQEEAPLPTEEAIREKWPELVKECAEGKPRLANALGKAPLRVEEEDGFRKVSFEVTNEAQKKWIEDGLLRNMENIFSRILDSGRVHLFVEVTPSEEIEPKLYMPAEKAQELMKSNPEVLGLVKDLGLDVN
jgi:DNA polymerase-3 subunit gamma/tau